MAIALLTGSKIGEPDVDESILVRAFEKLGTRAEIVAWDDPSIDFSRYEAAVLRSTWNYVPVRDRFCTFCETIPTRLFNPADIVRWNTDKRYLKELDAPIVPTSYSLDVPWKDVVVKPIIGAGSFATKRFALPDQIDEARACMRERPMMVQPYLKDVEGRGERSLVFIDGEFTHAIRKSPRFSDGVERVSDAVPIADEERDVGERALARFRDRILYGRVDVVRDEDGRVCVMELELVEPSLFLLQHPPAAEKLARATLQRIR